MKTKATNPFAVPFDLDECNRRCKSSMRNTPVGKWLAAACQEIERLRSQKESAVMVDERDPPIGWIITDMTETTVRCVSPTGHIRRYYFGEKTDAT